MDSFVSPSSIDPDEERPRQRPHPRFRRLAFHLAGSREIDIPTEMALVATARDDTRPAAAAHAMQTLVASHMEFLQGIASKVAIKNDLTCAEDDLLSEAIASFVRTIRRYHGEAHGARLATYATFVVSGDVMTYALRNRSAYAMGTSSQDRVMIFGHDDFIDTFQRENKVAFDLENADHVRLLAEIAQVGERTVRRVCAQRASGPTLDIDTIEITDDRPHANPQVTVEATSTQEVIAEVIFKVRETMSERNRTILDVMLAEDVETPGIRMRLAREHNITPERVGQIYRDSLGTIRDRLRHLGITSAAG